MRRINSVQRNPVVIVLYGVTGVGKSCLARVLCQRIPNCHIVATDMLRNVLTQYSIDNITKESSYAITHRTALSLKDKSNLLSGFKKQNSVVAKAIRGVIKWGRTTNSSLIIEGVNACGCVSNKHPVESCHTYLVICGDDNTHMRMLRERHSTHPSPPISISKYKRYFSNIRFMQEYLVNQAIAKGHETLDPSLIGAAFAADKVLKLIEAGE